MGQQLRLKQMWTLPFSADPLPTSVLFPCCRVPRDLHVCAPAAPHLLPALPSLLSPGSLNVSGLDCPLDWFLSFKLACRETSVPLAGVCQCHLGLVCTAGRGGQGPCPWGGCVQFGGEKQ